MADTVRALMEGMVPEMEDYARRGYFDRGEIDAIVKRREQFEYKLRRRNAIKSDFLRCDAPRRPCLTTVGVLRRPLDCRAAFQRVPPM
jgi:U3 small nucleolar RNA-associated protein 6